MINIPQPYRFTFGDAFARGAKQKSDEAFRAQQVSLQERRLEETIRQSKITNDFRGLAEARAAQKFDSDKAQRDRENSRFNQMNPESDFDGDGVFTRMTAAQTEVARVRNEVRNTPLRAEQITQLNRIAGKDFFKIGDTQGTLDNSPFKTLANQRVADTYRSSQRAQATERPGKTADIDREFSSLLDAVGRLSIDPSNTTAVGDREGAINRVTQHPDYTPEKFERMVLDGVHAFRSGAADPAQVRNMAIAAHAARAISKEKLDKVLGDLRPKSQGFFSRLSELVKR